jgi:SAM-dependent methyltransferase
MALSLPNIPTYPEVLERLKSNEEKFLDLGCCLGQDLRVLLAAGIPGRKLYGADLEAPFVDAGYELFGDRETSGLTFLIADFFDDSKWKPLEHQIDIINVGSFLHLWPLEKQVEACKRIVALLVPRPGSLVMGRQVGMLEAGPKPGHGDDPSKAAWRHNIQSFKKMWKKVGLQTGTKWDVHSELRDFRDEGLGDDKHRRNAWSGNESMKRIVFSVRRL